MNLYCTFFTIYLSIFPHWIIHISFYFCTSVNEVQINLPYAFPLLSSCMLLCQICLLLAVSLLLYLSWYHWHHLPHLLSPNWIFAQVATAVPTELYMSTRKTMVRIIFPQSVDALNIPIHYFSRLNKKEKNKQNFRIIQTWKTYLIPYSVKNEYLKIMSPLYHITV